MNSTKPKDETKLSSMVLQNGAKFSDKEQFWVVAIDDPAGQDPHGLEELGHLPSPTNICAAKSIETLCIC